MLITVREFKLYQKILINFFFELLNEFYKLTKTPILINTSFNIRGEPIVCTPTDAFKCFMGTKLDFFGNRKFCFR